MCCGAIRSTLDCVLNWIAYDVGFRCTFEFTADWDLQRDLQCFAGHDGAGEEETVIASRRVVRGG